jgi:hypothetical protein
MSECVLLTTQPLQESNEVKRNEGMNEQSEEEEDEEGEETEIKEKGQ